MFPQWSHSSWMVQSSSHYHAIGNKIFKSIFSPQMKFTTFIQWIFNPKIWTHASEKWCDLHIVTRFLMHNIKSLGCSWVDLHTSKIKLSIAWFKTYVAASMSSDASTEITLSSAADWVKTLSVAQPNFMVVASVNDALLCMPQCFVPEKSELFKHIFCYKINQS